MSNIDNARNGIFRNLDRSVFNSNAFVNFINSLRPNKLEDQSFVGMINSLDSSVLTDGSFIRALSKLHDRDDDIITNSKFSGAIQVMRTEFLKSAEFGQFLDRLDTNLLESRDENVRSIFSGQLKAEYFEVLANSLTYENLRDKSLNDFVNKIDISILGDGSFARFMSTTEAFVLTDDSFTETLGKLNDSVLTNGNFTEDVQSFSGEVRTTGVFEDLVSTLSASDLSRRNNYQSIVELNSNSVVVASNGGTIEINPFASAIAQAEYEGLAHVDTIIGGDALNGASTTRKVGFQEHRNTNITSDSQTWVIIHGFTSDSEADNINLLENSVLQHAKPNDRILSLDWKEAAENQIGAFQPYNAMTWGRPVAEYAARILFEKYEISPDDAKNKVNLIGHSLGAYVAGEIGKAFRDGFTMKETTKKKNFPLTV